MLSRGAGKRMACNAVVAVRLKISFFGGFGIARRFRCCGVLLPTCAKLVPRSGPGLAFDCGQFCQSLFSLSCVSVKKRRAMADASANIIFDLFERPGIHDL